MDEQRTGKNEQAGRRDLIVQRLDDELLVYDTESDEAHCLSAEAAVEFEAAPNDVSRRQALRKLAIVGAAAAGATPLVKSIVAPTPAHAASFGASCGATVFCNAGLVCCFFFGTGPQCLLPQGSTCSANTQCCHGNCCAGGTLQAGKCADVAGFDCSQNSDCCSGSCVIDMFGNGTCN